MALPTLTPTSQTSAIILPVTGNTDNVTSALPLGVYQAPQNSYLVPLLKLLLHTSD